MTRRLIILAACASVWSAAYAADESLRNLKALSVDQLLDLEVTSVAKHSEFGNAVSRSAIERDITGEARWRF